MPRYPVRWTEAVASVQDAVNTAYTYEVRREWTGTTDGDRIVNKASTLHVSRHHSHTGRVEPVPLPASRESLRRLLTALTMALIDTEEDA